MIPSAPTLHVFGLAFFAMGLVVWLKSAPLSHIPIGKAFRCMAIFGIVKGVNIWLFMLAPGGNGNAIIGGLPPVLSAISFVALSFFAVAILSVDIKDAAPVNPAIGKCLRALPYILLASWVVPRVALDLMPETASSLPVFMEFTHSDAAPHYFLGFPSAILAALGFARLASFRSYRAAVQRRAMVASVIFALCSVLLLFSKKAKYFPATVLNYENFEASTGASIFAVLALTAVGIGISVVAVLALFEDEEKIQVGKLVEDATAALDRRVVQLREALADRERAEARLREQATLFRTVLDTVPAMVTVKDTDLRHVFVNAAGLAHYGVTAGEIEGMTVADLLGSGRTGGTDAIHRHAMALESGQIHTEPEHRSVQDPDVVFWVRAAPIVQEGGRKTGVVAVSFDISEKVAAERNLRESQTLLQSMLDQLPDLVELRDVEGRYVLVNKICADWCGMAQDALIGKSASEIWRGTGVTDIEQRDLLAIAGRKPITRELETVFPDGTKRVVRSVRFPVFRDDASLLGVGVLATDITETKRAEQQLRQAQKMESVGQLTGGIAHDFNNLLGVIVGNLDFLAEQLQPEGDMQNLVESATAAALRGAELTGQLLAFSRNQPLIPKVFNLNAQIAGMLAVLRRTLGDAIDVEVVQEDALWPCEADPVQVETALLNLALNARDAMPAGGRLTIETANVRLDDSFAESEVAPGAYAMLSVTDTGTGMPPDVLEHVFEPFFTTKKVGEGTGLGLSMVFGFAKQSNGHISIQSEEARGTTVGLYLPRARDAA